MKDYRQYSMWLHEYPGDLTPRPELGGPLDVDVAIVGGGLSGLWTAYYLKKADPGVRVAIIDKEIAGFGGSGRNGAWCSPYFATPKETLAREHGRSAAIAMQEAMYATVDEVGRVVAEEGIDARFHKGGCITVARNRAQVERARGAVAYEREWGAKEDDWVFLGADEARARLNVAGALGAEYTPHCASVDPARLTRGLAEVVEKLGVAIYEQTPALAITPGYVHTREGLVHAEVVVRATEAFTSSLYGCERVYVPLYSLMIATEPLPDSFWAECGCAAHECFTDARNLIIYATRTDDGRIALGGRGAPYRLGSRTDDAYDRNIRIFELLCATLVDLFPQLRGVRITHHWGGPVAIPRDWCSSVGLDRSTGLAWAGGYVGDGFSTTNLAGRTLADLIRGVNSDLVELPWVNHRSRPWEREPLRWLGVNATLKSLEWADAEEARTGKSSRIMALVEKVVGH